jgi:hypothetical protein
MPKQEDCWLRRMAVAKQQQQQWQQPWGSWRAKAGKEGSWGLSTAEEIQQQLLLWKAALMVACCWLLPEQRSLKATSFLLRWMPRPALPATCCQQQQQHRCQQAALTDSSSRSSIMHCSPSWPIIQLSAVVQVLLLLLVVNGMWLWVLLSGCCRRQPADSCKAGNSTRRLQQRM